MSILELYFFSHFVLRSFTNGIDRIYGLQLSMVLSVAAIGLAVILSIYFLRRVAVPRQIYQLIFPLMLFILICFISYAVNALAEYNIRDSFHAWYVIVQHFYLLAIIVLVACIYRAPQFTRYVYQACMMVIVVDTCAAVGQYLTGHTIMVTQFDKYARVAGLSAIRSRSAWKSQSSSLCGSQPTEAATVFQLAACRHLPVHDRGADFWPRRTGVLLLGIVLGLYYLVRRPVLVPIFLTAAVLIVVASPFEALFGD